jgi:hypothetical protein
MEEVLINSQSLECSTYILKWWESINKQEAFEDTKVAYTRIRKFNFSKHINELARVLKTESAVVCCCC